MKALFVAASSLALTGAALAQDDAPTEEEGAPPDGEAMPPPENADVEPAAASAAPSLTLAKGKVLIAGSTININLSADAVGEPISLSPSVWYGVDDKLTIGLTHDFGTTPWTPRPGFLQGSISAGGVTVPVTLGTGICLTGEDSGCSDVYNNVGVDALYSLSQGKLSLAAHPALDIASLSDPFLLRLRLGVLGRYEANDKISIVFDPRLGIGITERDANNEYLDIPVWAWYAVNPKLGVYLHTGIGGSFEDFGDSLAIPLQIGASYMVNEKLTAGVDFGFSQINETADARALGLRVAYAL